ncbi:MAG TPA: UMP kinase [Candidatus Omnitrophota bacterium]|nr:UMP kinase [Candidatus Omnitrophota bacterium]
MKKMVVLSLGGSLIIPDEIDVKFLKNFRRIILKNSGKYQFIIVCGGGSIARKYINALKGIGMNDSFQSFAGISATRMNARFMSYFFGQNQERGIPHTLAELKNYAKKFGIIFCGALEYEPHQTSDSTAVEIAKYFRTDFINLTNVSGLHDKNPKKYKDAKFIPEISWKGLYTMSHREKFSPGQHFVIDQTASEMIMKNKITAYILGKNLKNFDNLLNNRKFTGTIVKG